MLDWDGTLVDTRQAVGDAMDYVLRLYDKEPWAIVKQKYRDTAKSVKGNFPNYFGAKADEAFARYAAYYRDTTMQTATPMAGAAEFLHLCQKKNIALYVVSNKEKSLLLAEKEQCFPQVEFVKMLGDGDTRRGKPSPDPVFAALQGADYAITRQNVWQIGDSRQDTDCAFAAGVQAVLLGEGSFMDERYKSEKSAAPFGMLQFADFVELNDFIARL